MLADLARASSKTRWRSFGTTSRRSAAAASYENARERLPLLDVAFAIGERDINLAGGQRPVVGGVPMKPLGARDPFKIGLVAIVVRRRDRPGHPGASASSASAPRATPPCSSTPPACARARTCRSTASRSAEVTGIELDGQARDRRLRARRATSSSARRRTAEVKVATLLGTHYLEVDPQGSGGARRRHDPARAHVGALQPAGRPRGRHQEPRGARRRAARRGADRSGRAPCRRRPGRHRPGARGRRPALRGRRPPAPDQVGDAARRRPQRHRPALRRAATTSSG